MEKAQVYFGHHRVVISDDVLSRLGSRYFPKKEAGKQLRTWVLRHVGNPAYKTKLEFDSRLLTSANEVYPEAAMADPVADLEIWDEWRTGLRRFPYPGVYTRLDIFHQERKTSATSSVGVLGEILAGCFAQSFIAPLVTVRPIRRWPDFIALSADRRYSFVESKSSASIDDPPPPGIEHVRPDLIGEGLADAVQELNAEPLLHVWLVFTNITSIQPLEMNVDVLEIDAPDSRKLGRKQRVPDAVVDGLTQRLLDSAAADVEPDFQTLVARLSGHYEEEVRKELWKRIKSTAVERTEEVLESEVPEDLRDVTADAIRFKIRGMKERKFSAAGWEGKRLAKAKLAASIGELSPLRQTSGTDQWLMISDLPAAELKKLKDTWKPDWDQSNKPWGLVADLPLWRCSSAILTIGNRDLEGTRVEGATRSPAPIGDLDGESSLLR